MAIFRPFMAYRPSKENQAKIPALPYDVISSDEARELANDNPLSFLHVDKPEIDLPLDTDPYSPAVYLKARENLLKLEQNKDFIHDESPCLYIYRQVMDNRVQTGIVGCASIDDYKNNIIKKHEHTLAKKEQDRINHVNTCDANTGPIFLTYRSDDIINGIVNDWIEDNEPVYDFVSDGVKQTVWVIDDLSVSVAIQKEFVNVDALYIADGHHRCASAVKVGEMRRAENPDYTGEEEFNFFLAVAFADMDLKIMDYNRVVRDLNGHTEEEFFALAAEKFDIEPLQCRAHPQNKHSFTMYYEGKWYLLTAKDGTFDKDDPVGRLDVSILQNNMLAPILGILNPKDDDRIDFIGGIRGLDELERRAKNDMRLAFAMYPTTVEDLMSIADAGKIMPPKSTWFEPKLLSGLFIHHLS